MYIGFPFPGTIYDKPVSRSNGVGARNDKRVA